MLLAQFLDRSGTGVWAAGCVLYFTFVVGLDARQLGVLLGAAGVAGIAGSPRRTPRGTFPRAPHC